MGECVVYWLFDDSCKELQQHGYVGISERFEKRLKAHKKNGSFPKGFSHKIIFRGTREQCLALEAALRPSWGIGWNWLSGGKAGATAPKSEEHRAKISAATKVRYTRAGEREKTIASVRAAFVKIDRGGANNSRFGITMLEKDKKTISEGRVGKGLGNQNWRNRKPYSIEARRKMSEASKRRWENASANAN